jgi:hypothetical protein
MSGVSGAGVTDALRALSAEVNAARAKDTKKTKGTGRARAATGT